MYEGQIIQNLVIEVTPSGRNRRRVTVPKQPLEALQAGGSNSNPQQQQHPEFINNNINSKKDLGNKKEKNTLRHSYHSQQSANGSTVPGRSSTNGSAVAGKGSSNYHGGNNDGPAAAGGGQRVQRQRSCVASLYGGQGRSLSAAAMPAATAYQRPKPAMQLYRPPTLRVSDDYTMTNGCYAYDGINGIDSKPGLNINAKEFVSFASNGSGGGCYNGTVSFSGPNGVSASALKHSKSSSHVVVSNGNGVSRYQNGGGGGLHHSRSGGYVIATRPGGGKDCRSVGGSSPPLRVHFTDDTIAYDPDNKVGMIQRSPTTTTSSSSSNYLLAAAPQVIPIKRSKSLGSAADLNNHGSSLSSSSGSAGNGGGGGLASPVGESASMTSATNAITDMAPFSEEVTSKLQQVLHDPVTTSARLVMEVVRQLFNKLVQGTRYAEPAARYCIAIIEKESGGGETFLETLLNTCQEYYQERDRLLRPPPPAPTRPNTPVHTHSKWVAYMTFLHEMYTQVKRRQRTVVSSTGPGLLLLTMLAECCVVSLEDQAKGGASMAQTECLFFILTGIGKDIELEVPPLMSKVMAAARDALFSAAKAPAVRKTLLQLIEMNAASWQLPAPAVMYYYPGVGGK